MSLLDIRLAKAFSAGLKRTVRESRMPIRSLDVQITAVDDRGETLVYRQHGVPPFTTMEVIINGEYVGGFVGHADVHSQDISDTP